MKKYCKFLESMYDGDELIWEKDREYLIEFEDTNENAFMLENNTEFPYGITKDGEGKKFMIVEKEE